MNSLKSIKESWAKGKPILLFDAEDREGEVDIMIASEFMTPRIIAQMRIDAGGLICCAMSSKYCDAVGLPFLTDIFQAASTKYQILPDLLEHGLPYGARSAFSFAINHVNSFTGITDIDRSMTIKEVGEIGKTFLEGKDIREQYKRSFRIPGHVPLLRGANNLLKSRLGHTELSLAICEVLGFAPTVTMCEMMDAKSGKALSVPEAKKYAEKHDLLYFNGEQIIQAWCDFKQINQSEIFRRT